MQIFVPTRDCLQKASFILWGLGGRILQNRDSVFVAGWLWAQEKMSRKQAA